MASTVSPEAASILSGTNDSAPPEVNAQPSASLPIMSGPNVNAIPQPQAARAVNAGPAPQVNAQQSVPTLPTTGAEAQPVPPHVSRLAGLGKLAESLFTGATMQYLADPQTGQITAVPVKQKAGQIFRNLLGGALMGMAAGEGAHDFAGGAGRGFTAAYQNKQAQDAQRYQRAQQELASEQATQRQDQSDIYNEARIQLMNASNLRADRELNDHEQEFISNHNDLNSELAQKLEESGATQNPILVGGQDINGQMDNGGELAKQFTSNPESLRAPQGYYRVWTSHTDLNGLKQNAVGQWEDESGNPVDLSDRTTWTALDVRKSLMDQPVRHDGVWLNKFTHTDMFDPKQTYSTTLGELFGLATESARGLAEQALINQRNASANRQNAIAKNGGKAGSTNANQVRVLNQQRLIAVNELAQATKNYDDAGYAAARKKLDDIDSQLAKLRAAQIVPPTGKSTVYDPQGNAHFVDTAKLKAFLADPQYKGWHQ